LETKEYVAKMMFVLSYGWLQTVSRHQNEALRAFAGVKWGVNR
jgi:hypothetical protein